MEQGLKIRIYPSLKQEEQLTNIFGCKRFVYNYFLEYSKENKDYSYNSWSKLLTTLKNSEEHAFLKEADKFALQNALRDLKQTYRSLFAKRIRSINYKYKDDKQTYKTNYTNNNIKLSKESIRLPKLGDVPCKLSKDITSSKIISVTVSKSKDSKYYASIIYEGNVVALEKTNKEVGIDIGVRTSIYTSDNEKYLNIEGTDKIDNKIRKYQRRLSRKKKGSKNRIKVKKKLAKLYSYKKDYIMDKIQKATKEIVSKNDVIYIEDLDVNKLLNIQDIKKKKRKMISSKLSTIIRLLEYKAKMYEKQVHKIYKYYASSHYCSRCDTYHEIKDKEIFKCPNCNLVINRDYNASINILKRGKYELAQVV